ncbi:MAG: hypothetical protein C0469_14245 [Cyanobacteria bacterium DS2.3.42]|nr:hypothetical protein [Cyanobacteria bacterium DS2.3.42]
MTSKKQCKEDANCHEERENVEQSSDSKQALEDKRKEELYSDGGGRKTDFGAEELEPPHVTDNESKK